MGQLSSRPRPLPHVTGWRRRSPNALAITTAKVQLTVGDVEKAAGQVARDLAEWAAGRQSCLLLPSADPAAFLVGLIACRQAGVVVVPWRDDSLPLPAVEEVVRPDGVLRIDPTSLGAAVVAPLHGPSFQGERIGELIMLTSGSTGSPKGVALDFNQVLLNALSAGAAMEIWRCQAWSIDIDMALMSALCHLLMAWQYDLPLHHLSGRDGPDVIKLFQSCAMGFGGSPIQLVRLPEKLSGKASPRMLASSGDFLSPAMIDEVLASFPDTRLNKLYGLTEVAGRFCCLPHDLLLRHKAAVGYPLPGFQARLSSEAGDEMGEIEVSTPLLMAGYYRTGGVFEPRPAGWFGTGDLGSIAADGLVTLAGRTDDVMKVGGEKVDRHSIELALADMLGQWDYCVLGVSHPLVGVCPALFVSRSRCGEELPTWRQIVAHLRARLPPRFIPALMYALEGDLPRLANGKIDRETLKAGHQTLARLK